MSTRSSAIRPPSPSSGCAQSMSRRGVPLIDLGLLVEPPHIGMLAIVVVAEIRGTAGLDVMTAFHLCLSLSAAPMGDGHGYANQCRAPSRIFRAERGAFGSAKGSSCIRMTPATPDLPVDPEIGIAQPGPAQGAGAAAARHRLGRDHKAEAPFLDHAGKELGIVRVGRQPRS